LELVDEEAAAHLWLLLHGSGRVEMRGEEDAGGDMIFLVMSEKRARLRRRPLQKRDRKRAWNPR
jgi:hypothetical protein